VGLVAALAFALLAGGVVSAQAAPKDRGDRGAKSHSCAKSDRNIERGESRLDAAKDERAKAQRKFNSAKKAAKAAKSGKAKSRANNKKRAAAKNLDKAKDSVKAGAAELADDKRQAAELGC
jgi:predicted  nucleic acid-binding Zn-ribbon protein